MGRYLLILLLVCSSKLQAQNQFEIIAGTGISLGFSGDGGLAKNAQLHNPYATCVDKKGNVFVADYLNHRIRKVDTAGVIITLAGGDQPGYYGDGGLAVNSLLNYPTGVAVDTLGNVFIADSKNNSIRVIDVLGNINTYAGSTFPGSSGDGGQAAFASFDNPTSVIIDKNQNLFIVDYHNNKIRKINSSGIVSTVAGNGTSGFSGDGFPAVDAQLNFPEGFAINQSGEMYISDTQNRRIRKIDSQGVISTFAGVGFPGFSGDGGNALFAQMSSPKGIATDTAGNVYFADYDNNRIRQINSFGVIRTVLGEGGIWYATPLSLPIGIDCDSKNQIYVSDTYNSSIRRVTVPASIESATGVKETPKLKETAFLLYPNPSSGLVTIFTSDVEDARIVVYDYLGQEINAHEDYLSANRIKIDLSEEASGMYFVHMFDNERVTIRKVSIIK